MVYLKELSLFNINIFGDEHIFTANSNGQCEKCNTVKMKWSPCHKHGTKQKSESLTGFNLWPTKVRRALYPLTLAINITFHYLTLTDIISSHQNLRKHKTINSHCITYFQHRPCQPFYVSHHKLTLHQLNSEPDIASNSAHHSCKKCEP